MFPRPLPQDHWIQALADNGQWMPPPEWAQDYGWMDQLPRIQEGAGREVRPPDGSRMRFVSPEDWQNPAPEWTDIPDWLQALNDDEEYRRSRVMQGPYDGWGGGAMQARRRGLR
jgi:hypothetical protein